ncbi:hypothetical protein ACKZDW_17970 [Ralstonia syzygii subsp. celebesensis]|uniref:DUF6630 domain-containing protein n=2 Tax=Ralstonia syzygii subsp. celebesensis TaxID=1310168 RepID=A0A1U9VI90_9RALS|nr:hypothetical protein [Ralstonia syzygii]AQW30408.1 hypothetical protein B0B51_10840 [blood disease bacterium A2-HR MARDI]QQV55762.1 hypothetical protein JK151_01375 [Ralstonia syzygii subsp. celebesensis]CCA80980.1 conserved hypothethical protein [blood disease bacterium R229]
MLKFFKRLFSQPATTAQADTTEPLSDADILRAYFSPPAEAIDALVDLVRLVAAPLEDTEATRLVARARFGEAPGDSIAGHLQYALYDPDEATSRTLSLFVDWKAHDEIEWQAAEILETLGIGASWKWTREPAQRCVAVGLLDFDGWLRPHGYQLLFLDTGCDDYFAFPIHAARLEAAQDCIHRARLPVEQADAFRVSQQVEP